MLGFVNVQPGTERAPNGPRPVRKKGGVRMGADEKKLVQAILAAVAVLPEEKREYILGYAEGVIAMAGRMCGIAERAQDNA